MINEMAARVVGVSIDNRQEIIANLKVDDCVWLLREPTNPFDGKAILVVNEQAEIIGCLDRERAAEMAPHLDNFGTGIPAAVTDLLQANVLGSLRVQIRFELLDLPSWNYSESLQPSASA